MDYCRQVQQTWQVSLTVGPYQHAQPFLLMRDANFMLCTAVYKNSHKNYKATFQSSYRFPQK